MNEFNFSLCVASKKKKKKRKKVVKQNTRHASEWIFQDVSISLKAEYLIQSFRDFLKIFV